MVGQPAVRLLLQTQKVRNDPPAIGAGGFSYFVKVRMITYLHKKSRKPFKDFLLGGAAGGRLVFSLESYYGLSHKCPNKQVGALPEE